MCSCKRFVSASTGSDPKLTVKEFKLTPQPDVTGMFRHMLKLAEAGKIRAAAVAVHADRVDTGSSYALGNGDIAHLVLACQRVIYRLLQEEGD